MGQAALEAALSGDDITGGALNFWGPKTQAALGRKAPGWAAQMPDYSDIGETRFHRPRADGGEVDAALHMLRRHFDGSDGSFVDPMGNVAIPSAGPEGEQAAVAVDNAERLRAAENAARLAKEIQSYEASMSGIRQQSQDIQSMTHAPEKPRAPISVEALGKNREFGSAPYDVAGPLSSFAQGAYDIKTLPLYMYPPTAPLGMAIDTAEGVAAGSPTQVAMGAFGSPVKLAKSVIAPLAVATGVTAPDEAEAAKLSKLLRAYHGSPHKFDRFDLSKIGTGEGAQAYGHGLYFAESEPIAKFYRDSTRPNLPQVFIGGENTGKTIQQSDQTLKNILLSGQTPEEYHASLVNSPRAEGIKNKLATASREDNGLGFSDYDMAKMEHEDFQNTLGKIRDYFGKNLRAYVPEGHMYDVNINASPEQLLNWDKPLREQSGHVQEILSSAYPEMNFRQWKDYGSMKPYVTAVDEAIKGTPLAGFGGEGWLSGKYDVSAGRKMLAKQHPEKLEAFDNAISTFNSAVEPTGKDVLHGLAKSWESEGGLTSAPNAALASERLNEAGIPGIKYLDARSRDLIGEPTHNYVIFDDKLIDINRRYADGGLIEDRALEISRKG
jgi:hypothetical protein